MRFTLGCLETRHKEPEDPFEPLPFGLGVSKPGPESGEPDQRSEAKLHSHAPGKHGLTRKTRSSLTACFYFRGGAHHLPWKTPWGRHGAPWFPRPAGHSTFFQRVLDLFGVKARRPHGSGLPNTDVPEPFNRDPRPSRCPTMFEDPQTFGLFGRVHCVFPFFLEHPKSGRCCGRHQERLQLLKAKSSDPWLVAVLFAGVPDLTNTIKNGCRFVPLQVDDNGQLAVQPVCHLFAFAFAIPKNML